MNQPEFYKDGAELIHGAALTCLFEFEHLFGTASPGLRVEKLGSLEGILSGDGSIGAIAAGKIGGDARPVRVIAFNKTSADNWALSWHQDRTIFAGPKCEIHGYERWSSKQGLVHVEPPFPIIERMATIRLHLDAVENDNAPLRISLGSHRLGLVSESSIHETVSSRKEHVCLADAGDVWIYSTPIIHASDRASSGRNRRVVQIDYSIDDLPRPLNWSLT